MDNTPSREDRISSALREAPKSGTEQREGLAIGVLVTVNADMLKMLQEEHTDQRTKVQRLTEELKRLNDAALRSIAETPGAEGLGPYDDNPLKAWHGLWMWLTEELQAARILAGSNFKAHALAVAGVQRLTEELASVRVALQPTGPWCNDLAVQVESLKAQKESLEERLAAALKERDEARAELDIEHKNRITWQGLVYLVCGELDFELGRRISDGTGVLAKEEDIIKAIRGIKIPLLNQITDLRARSQEAERDTKRLEWLESHVENLSRISRPLNDTITLEYVSDISSCVAEEETVEGIRVVIDAAMGAQEGE